MFSKVTAALLTDHNRKHDSGQDVARIAIDEDGRIAYASEAFCEISHKSVHDLKNQPAANLLSFTGNEKAPLQDLSTIASGTHKIRINGNPDPLSFHFDWIKTPLGRRYLVGSHSPRRNKKPEKIAIERFSEILAQSDRSSAELGEDEIRQLVEISNEIMLVVGLSGTIEKASPALSGTLGYAPDNAGGLKFSDLFEDAEKPELDTIPQNGNINFESRIITGAGQPRWVQWNVRRAGEKYYCCGRDVTDIKNQQAALQKREKQLGEAESIGRMGHWHWTIGETRMEWSAEIYRIFGVEPGSFLPTLETMNKMVNRADISRLNQAFQRALIEENDYEMEFRIATTSGETRYIRCEGRCARDDNNEVYALFGVMQDMTERMIYESELKAAKENAERAYAARTQFLANMSHELRTPLNAIIGFSEMMQHQLLGPIGTEKYLEYIAGIRESGEHLLDLISDILDMSKIEAGKYELDLSEIYPAKLIKLAAHMMEGRAYEAKVKITFAQDMNENYKIVADRRAVLQILLNLLSNAVKFTNENGEVKIELQERENGCTLKVSDNGIGIPAHKLATITKPFEQVSSSYARNHQGSGLGLAITKELTEMHGGTLLVESRIGEGTAVTVRLPASAFKAGQEKQTGR